MATTEHFENGGSTTIPFSFPILANSDLKVEIYNATTGVWDLKTENTSGQTDNDYTISNTNVVFNSATPAGTGNVHIYRNTNVDNPAAVFAAGSSIRAVDLNNNQTQVLYSTQEAVGQVVRETDLKDSIITSAKIANKTIVNDDINDSAAIQGTKISPNFGNQNIIGNRQLQLTGTDTVGDGDIHLSGGTDGAAVITVTESANNVSKLIIDGKGNGGGNAVNGAGKIAEFIMTNTTPSVDVTGNLNVNGNTTLVNNLDVDGTTTLDTTTVDGTLTANSVTVGGLNISYTDATNQGSEILHTGTDDLRLQIAGNQMVFEQSDGENFMSMSHENYQSPEWENLDDTQKANVQGRVNIFHAGHGVKISTQIDGIKVNGKVDLDSITGTGVVTTGTSTSDTQVYSSKRAGEIIDARIIELVDEVGGFVPIANETSFPNENPDINDGAGTLVSVPLANNLTSDGSGVITIANGTVGNSTVTITDAGNNKTFTAGFGIIVETTSTLNTYKFHRYVPQATDVTTVAGDIDNVNTVAGQISPNNNISAVASVSDKLSAFDASFRGKVTDVANDATDIGAVAGKADEIGRLGTAEAVADLAILGTTDAVADMATIADTENLISNIGTVAGIHGNVTSVADNEININAVKNNETNINAVKNNESNINSAVSNASNINTVAGQLGASGSVTTVATNITNVNNASTYLNNFLALYLGEAATAPVVDTFGNPVTEGDFYFNTVNKQLQVFNGSVFTSIFAFAFDIEKTATAAFNALYTAAVGQNEINLGGLAITGAVFEDEKIATNRISLTKGSATYNLGGITT